MVEISSIIVAEYFLKDQDNPFRNLDVNIEVISCSMG